MLRLPRRTRLHPRAPLHALACAVLSAVPAAAEVGWHAGMTEARSAAAASQRPVLALFTASWSTASTAVEQTALGSAEAAALVGACFEPVRVDVDQQADLTRRLGVSHVPTVCILGPDDRLLASFACPDSSPEFVAAAAHAAQRAARVTGDSATAAAEATGDAPAQRLHVQAAPKTPSEEAAGVFGDTRSARLGRPAAAAPTRGSISLVTAKVRRLSDFANDRAPATVTTVALAESGTAPQGDRYQDTQAYGQRYPLAGTATPEQPSLPTAPPQWPAEKPAAPLAAALPATAAARPVIEPGPAAAPTALPQQATPWLAAPATVAAAEPESSAVVSDIPSTTPAAPTTTNKPILSALQRPFAAWTKPQPAAVAPPTMPPARPQSGLAIAQPATPPAVAAAPTTAPAPTVAAAPAAPVAAPAAPTFQPVAPPAAQPAPAAPQLAAQAAPAAVQPDTHGSMPLGLEGYCPVTLAEKGAWVEGRAQWGARHRGRTYLFAGPDEQKAFLTDPDRYAPALSGDDPVLAFETGKSTPGQRRFGVSYQQRVYLFATPETRSTFAANPDRYTTRIQVAEQPALNRVTY